MDVQSPATMTKIKNILISQPKPENEKNYYNEISQKYQVNIDFRQFIKVEGVPSKEVRKEKINILDYSAIIFNSRIAIDHFFRVCEEMRIKMPETTKYFCISEAVALYLQKYIQYRKRKVFFANGKDEDLKVLITKHKNQERFLVPCADVKKQDLGDFLAQNGFKFDFVSVYQTVSSDLSDLAEIWYDVIVFFSPLGIKSLYDNYPNFVQGEKKIGAFGKATAQAVIEAGLRLDLEAPTPECPSITAALDKLLSDTSV